jgi:hypothetical protein
MRTKESIKREIQDLMAALAQNNFGLRRMERRNMWLNANELLHARHEIMKSIAHRQGLLIEIMENEMEYSTKREAA